MYCPKWLYLIPGFLLVAVGLAGYGIAMPSLTLLGATFDAHTLLFASLAILLGFQSIFFALFTKTFAIGAGLLPEDPRPQSSSARSRWKGASSCAGGFS
jgi:hypothetical protein